METDLWYMAAWVLFFYESLHDGLDSGSTTSRPTEQVAFRSLAIQSIYAMRLRKAEGVMYE